MKTAYLRAAHSIRPFVKTLTQGCSRNMRLSFYLVAFSDCSSRGGGTKLEPPLSVPALWSVHDSDTTLTLSFHSSNIFLEQFCEPITNSTKAGTNTSNGTAEK